MHIDCRNLDCPEPVIKTMKALESLEELSNLEILINSQAAKDNIIKFLSTNELKFDLEDTPDGILISTTKTKSLINKTIECSLQNKKIIYLKFDQVGGDLLGKSLLANFLKAMISMEASKRASHIICVNEAVYLTTSRAHICYPVLKELENLGVKILSCGACLEGFGLVDKLGIGEIGNAFEIMNLLVNNETIYL